jgi:hypothetical protein
MDEIFPFALSPSAALRRALSKPVMSLSNGVGGKISPYRVKPFMLRQAQHERLDDRK